MKTELDKDYILNNLCRKLDNCIKSNIKETEYMIKPKGKTLYIIKRNNKNN